MPREWILRATLWKCQNVGEAQRRILKTLWLHSQVPVAGASPISLLQCNGRDLKLEKSISVGQTGNPWQSDGSAGFKGRAAVLSGPSCKVKSDDLAVLEAVPFIHGAVPEPGAAGVEGFLLPCALGQQIPLAAVTAVVPGEQIPAEDTCSGSAELVDLPVAAPKTSNKPGLLLPWAASSTEMSPGITFCTGFRRGHSELKKTPMFCLCHDIPAPLLTVCCSQGVSVIPRDPLPRRNQQCFWARAGTHPSPVWHLTNEAGLGELHSWTAVSKFHCSLGSRNTSSSGPRSFRAQLRAQSTKSSPLTSPRAGRQEYEIFHGTDVPFSHLGSLAKGEVCTTKQSKGSRVNCWRN